MNRVLAVVLVLAVAVATSSPATSRAARDGKAETTTPVTSRPMRKAVPEMKLTIHGRAELPWAERIELDVWYVEHRSPRVDLEILLRTPLALFRGTYRGATGGWR